jgi:hypothetical protein
VALYPHVVQRWAEALTFWRGVALVAFVAIAGGIALLRGVGLVIAFWTAFKYMDYSLWVKAPLATLLILAIMYLLRDVLRDERIGRRN